MNVAIIGSGNMGRVHAHMAANCGLRIVACGDTRLKNARALAAEYDAKAAVDCLALIRRDDVDIVVVTTPTPSHTDYVIAAARAGKHIFCEKPFGRTVQQCKAAMAEAKKAKVKLFIAHVVRYFQEFEALRAHIEAGKAGHVGFIKTYRGGAYPHGEGDWFGDFSQSGGVTFDCIIHDFDWLRYLLGEPASVFSQNLKTMTSQFMDYALATFTFRNGAITHTVGTWAHPAGFRVKVEVCGDGGMLTFDSAEAPFALMMRESGGGRPGVLLPGSPVTVSPYQLEWQDFIGWLEGKWEPRVTPEDGLAAVRMAAAALESADQGKPVRL